MKASSLSEIKKELQTHDAGRLVELALRMAKYKKENKELLHYLLFEAANEETYVRNIRKEVEEQFLDLNTTTMYYTKKGVRKILRLVNKHIKYSGMPVTTVELLIHFCRQIREAGIKVEKSTALQNLYNNQLKKIDKVLEALHEDLRYDYRKEMEGL